MDEALTVVAGSSTSGRGGYCAGGAIDVSGGSVVAVHCTFQATRSLPEQEVAVWGDLSQGVVQLAERSPHTAGR